MRPQVFVVEGKNDQFKLEQVLEHPIVITTNGSAIDKDVMKILKKLDETHDIILFLDPDHAGERIRRLVAKELTHVYHAFIKKDLAISKNEKKIGVEHASIQSIKEALKHIKMIRHDIHSDITHTFLHDVGLMGSKSSKQLRLYLCERLGIGYTNAKTLYQRLHLFGIDQKMVNEVIHAASSEETIRTKLS
ncbi:MAG: ribonuclease M5 [Acholeplasmataceae bacterium]|jgi:ribonuclease M5|nr:ribonuclease M5 [Acholeplasmataceae bacterium]